MAYKKKADWQDADRLGLFKITSFQAGRKSLYNDSVMDDVRFDIIDKADGKSVGKARFYFTDKNRDKEDAMRFMSMVEGWSRGENNGTFSGLLYEVSDNGGIFLCATENTKLI
jgi:hypothetical protein